MKYKELCVSSTVILILLLTSCGQLGTVDIPTMTAIPPSATASVTPTPFPSSTPTPTITPTPIGGGQGLLLSGHSCHINSGTQDSTECVLYIYDINSQKTSVLIQGYSALGVSPDGRKVALQNYENEKTDLFVIDVANPKSITPLYEDVIPYQSVWFPGTDWIGFIAKKNGKDQVFIIHPDGTNLIQVTNSRTGATHLYEVFHDGVFWGEGTDMSFQPKWTKLDGTERVFESFIRAITPDGKSVIMRSDSQDPKCGDCNYESLNLETDKIKHLSLSDPQPKTGFLYPFVQPLSDDKLLVMQLPVDTIPAEYWIYAPDGRILIDFSTFVHTHDAIAADTKDFYRIIGGGYDLTGQRLSPDGNWLLIEHALESQIPMTGGNSTVIWTDSTFHLLNIFTSELRELPGISFDFDNSDNSTTATSVEEFWWIELP